MSVRLFLALVLASTAASGVVAQPISLGQKDTFQDGTLNNWTNGLGAGDPINIPNGGPAGAGDRYMQVSSGQFGGGLRIVVFNVTQWTGNYLSAGVSSIEMDLMNTSGLPMSMRWVMRTQNGSQTVPGYVSTVPFSLAADNLWHHAVFELDAAHLTAINNPPPLNTFLTNVGEGRILHSVNPALIGDFGDFQFGVDNILASSVPEPVSWVMLGLLAGCGGAWWRRPGTKVTTDDTEARSCSS